MMEAEVGIDDIAEIGEKFELLSDELMLFALSAEYLRAYELGEIKKYFQNAETLLQEFSDLQTPSNGNLVIALKAILETERAIGALEPTLEEIEIRILLEPDETNALSELLAEISRLRRVLERRKGELKAKWEGAKGVFFESIGVRAE